MRYFGVAFNIIGALLILASIPHPGNLLGWTLGLTSLLIGIGLMSKADNHDIRMGKRRW